MPQNAADNQEKTNKASKEPNKEDNNANKTTKIPFKSKRSKANSRGSLKNTILDLDALFGVKANVEVVESEVRRNLPHRRQTNHSSNQVIPSCLHCFSPSLLRKLLKSWLTWELFPMFAKVQPLWLQE